MRSKGPDLEEAFDHPTNIRIYANGPLAGTIVLEHRLHTLAATKLSSIAMQVP